MCVFTKRSFLKKKNAGIESTNASNIGEPNTMFTVSEVTDTRVIFPKQSQTIDENAEKSRKIIRGINYISAVYVFLISMKSHAIKKPECVT